MVVERDGLAVHFLSRTALLKNERAAGRPKDILDAQRIENDDG